MANVDLAEYSDITCFTELLQSFLVCTTIHKAKNLAILNADTFTVVCVDKESKRTKTCETSDSPFYNEYFVFELYKSLNELLKMKIVFTVFNKTYYTFKNVPIGELVIDIRTIWNQNNHSVYKKWGALVRLDDDMDSEEFSQGFLQIDITIVSKFEKPATILFESRDYDKIEENLLEPVVSAEKGTTFLQYTIKIFRGIFVAKHEYLVKVQFAGINAKTKATSCTKLPEWMEQIEFIWMHPSPCKTITIQIMKPDCCSFLVLSQCDLQFSQLTNPVSELPELGPTYLHFYDTTHTKYFGRILIWIKSENVTERIFTKNKFYVTHTEYLNEKIYWDFEVFLLKLYLFNINFIHTTKQKLKIRVFCGEYQTNDFEIIPQTYNETTLKFYKPTNDKIPILWLHMSHPDNRIKYETDNRFYRINVMLEKQLENYKIFKNDSKTIKMERKFLKIILKSLMHNLKLLLSNLYFKAFKEVTVWDRNHMNWKIKLTETILEELNDLEVLVTNRSDFNLYENLYKKLIEISEKIKNIYTGVVQDKWPDLIIEIISGTQVLATYKADSKLFLFHQNRDCCGVLSKIEQSIIFKTRSCSHTCLNCGCFFGSARMACWIGPEHENFDSLPTDFAQNEDLFITLVDPIQYSCNVYIHQAKLRSVENSNEGCNGQVFVFIDDLFGRTNVVYNSLSPIWNQTISFNCLVFSRKLSENIELQPVIMIEVWKVNEKKKLSEIIGSSYIYPKVKTGMSKIEESKKFEEIKIDVEMNETSSLIDQRHTENTLVGETPRNAYFEKLKDNLKNVKYIKTYGKNKQNVNIDYIDNFPPLLNWVSIFKNAANKGDLLMSAEIFLNLNACVTNSTESSVAIFDDIPSQIRPVMVKFKVESIFYGMRNAVQFPHHTIGRYRIEILIGELIIKSGISGQRYGNSIIFLDPYGFGYVYLPQQFEYWPSLIIKLIECTKTISTIGAAMITKTQLFYVEDKLCNLSYGTGYDTDYDADWHDDNEQEKLIKKPEKKSNFSLRFSWKKPWHKLHFKNEDSNSLSSTHEDEENKYTWWTKFYSVARNDKTKHQLTIYDSELENQSEFSFLRDWAIPIAFAKGGQYKNTEEKIYSTLKCKIQIKKSSEMINENSATEVFNGQLTEISSLTTEATIVVRVYIVQGINLRSKDSFGTSDSYLKIEYGDHVISDHAHYIPNQTNPIFGKQFQLNGVLPKDHLMRISVLDRDRGFSDDLIGSTVIDIEDRLRSKHRAFCGIPNEYSRSGYNIWRDVLKPSDILKQICKKFKLGTPIFVGKKIQVANITFDDTTEISRSEALEERLCLSVLKKLKEIPFIGFNLVPEYVETRSLYHSKHPGIEQGKLQMWIDIFDPKNIPPPLDITPEPPRNFELRLIVWDVSDVILNDANIFGKKMSDIYVKVWLNEIDEAQYTDVHYRSMNGVGNFNWRMIFRFKYSMAEQLVVIIANKGLLDSLETINKLPPILNIQIWDNDSISADDFLGSTTINLSNILIPSETAAKCVINHKTKRNVKYDDLFFVKKIRGWFPCHGYMDNSNTIGLTGKIDLELEILSEDNAALNLAGLGRNPPNPLPEPNRPETSFKWYTNPLKSLKSILWPQIRKLGLYCCGILILLMIVYFIISQFTGPLLTVP